MRIKWFGHACFEIVTGKGTRILTDPFDESVGYKVPDIQTDIVTTSHDHFDHNNTGMVKGGFRHINKPGDYVVSDVRIKGVHTWHDDTGGSKRGPNVVFVYQADGLSVCHLGDLGHELDSEQEKELSDMDLLMIPVGGTYTVNAKTAAEIVGVLKPRVVIPMHYKTKVLSFPIDGVEPFLKLSGGLDMKPVKMLEVNRDNIGSLPGLILMDYE